MNTTTTEEATEAAATQNMITDLGDAIRESDRIAEFWRGRAVFHSETHPSEHTPLVLDDIAEASHPDRNAVVDKAALAERWRAEARDAWALAGMYARRADALRQAQTEARDTLDELTTHQPAG
jgi:hypothetical protein